MKRRSNYLIIILCLVATKALMAQKKYTMHFQQTVIIQNKPAMKAQYSGTNSLLTPNETQVSVTSTFYAGLKLWKWGDIYINPEMSGGSGLSGAKGIGGFPNGEAFRIGDSSPKIYLARGFYKQTIPLSSEMQETPDEPNQVEQKTPIKYINLVIGKFGLADYFDNNKYSHDPRVQFLNWGLMSNGAWDYPANVRGYTVGYVAEYISPKISLRISTAALPTSANGPDLNYNFKKSYSHSAELEKPYKLGNQNGILRVLGYYSNTYMGNYTEATARTDKNIILTRKDGRTKKGFGINLEHDLSENMGLFGRYSWNDGHNETWAFTEIDRSLSIGFLTNGAKWNRIDDTFGLALLTNGLSDDHQRYLKTGGNGFILGDGKLNYSKEQILELFYKYHLHDRHFWITPNYQFINNPGYNKDRGPAHVLSIRVHTEF